VGGGGCKRLILNNGYVVKKPINFIQAENVLQWQSQSKEIKIHFLSAPLLHRTPLIAQVSTKGHEWILMPKIRSESRPQQDRW